MQDNQITSDLVQVHYVTCRHTSEATAYTLMGTENKIRADLIGICEDSLEDDETPFEDGASLDDVIAHMQENDYILLQGYQIIDAASLQRVEASGRARDDAQPIGEIVTQIVEEQFEAKAEADPLPTAFAMLDSLIARFDDVGIMARAAKIALGRVVKAGTDMHDLIAVDLTTHVYGENDEIPADCAHYKVMREWHKAMSGNPSVYYQPTSPLPWQLHIGAFHRLELIGADGSQAMPAINNPTTAQIRNALAMLEGVNAQAAMSIAPEIAVVLDPENGIGLHVRGDAQCVVHIVDYEVLDDTATSIISEEGKPVKAHYSKSTTRDMRPASPDFWLSLQEQKEC